MLPAGPRGGACCTAGQKAEPPRRFFLFLFGKRGARAGNPLLLSRSRFGSIRAASRKSPARACAPKDRGLTLVLISRCHWSQLTQTTAPLMVPLIVSVKKLIAYQWNNISNKDVLSSVVLVQMLLVSPNVHNIIIKMKSPSVTVPV